MGKTVIISSHILLELSEICTTIGIIDKRTCDQRSCRDQRQLSHLSRLKIKVVGDLQPAIHQLKERPEVSDIIEGHGYIECSFGGSDEDKSALLKSLVQGGADIYHFEETAGNLESIFMHLTEEGDDD